MQQAIRDLQEAAIVMADIQRRQASVQRIQAEELDTVRERQKRIETNLAEATDKLNGLIGFLDDYLRRGKS